MTAVTTEFTVRAMVTEVWDHVLLAVNADTPVGQVKRDALFRALRTSVIRPEDYVIKFRGALVLDESVTLGALGAGANAPFIILPARRQPVR